MDLPFLMLLLGVLIVSCAFIIAGLLLLMPPNERWLTLKRAAVPLIVYLAAGILSLILRALLSEPALADVLQLIAVIAALITATIVIRQYRRSSRAGKL